MKKMENMERGIIVADYAIPLTFSMIDFLDSGIFICSPKVLHCTVVSDILLNKVAKYSLSLAFVGKFKDVERFPSKSVQSNCRKAF